MLCYLILQAVVLHTVIKNQFHVMTEFMNVVVNIKGQFLLYGAEIHWVLDYVEVVVNVVTTWVNGLVEVVASF